MKKGPLVPKKMGQKLNAEIWGQLTSAELSSLDNVERDRLAICLIYNMGLQHFLKILPSESKQELSDLQTGNNEDLALTIVRSILDDIQGRYGLDRMILGGPDRDSQEILISMFEKWRQLVSQNLYAQGLINECYKVMENHEIQKLSLYDLLEIRENYLRIDGKNT
jgi:hypothetical protein